MHHDDARGSHTDDLVANSGTLPGTVVKYPRCAVQPVNSRIRWQPAGPGSGNDDLLTEGIVHTTASRTRDRRNTVDT